MNPENRRKSVLDCVEILEKPILGQMSVATSVTHHHMFNLVAMLKLIPTVSGLRWAVMKDDLQTR